MEQKESFKERCLDFLSDIWDFLWPMLICAPVFCISSVIQLIGFTKIAFISFVVLMSLLGIYCLFFLIVFVIAKRDEDVNQMNRCIFTWIHLGGAALIGTVVAHLVGLF